MFVEIDVTLQRWRSIYSTVGVSRLVCNGNQPAPVCDDVIGSLRSREDASGLIRLVHRPNFKSGDKVRVLDGAFYDCFGIYDGMTDRERVAILLDLLGRKVRILFDAEAIAAA
jgi:transcriptional antiterminator RfaH